MLSAGTGRVDVSPQESMFLWGYPHVERMSSGVHDPLFATAKRGPMDRNDLRKMLVSAGKQAEINDRVTPHRLRHTFVITYLRNGGDPAILNCGYGHGYSVREVLASVEKANEAPLKISEQPRRAGDPPELIAVAQRVREVLGWEPRFDDLDTIVKTSLAWERKIAAQDPSAYWAS